jgi:hypothetical protein
MESLRLKLAEDLLRKRFLGLPDVIGALEAIGRKIGFG